MIELDWPWVLLILPLPLLVYWLGKPARRNEAALSVPFYQQLVALSPTPGRQVIQATAGRRLAFTLILLTWLCLVVAASKPQWVGEPVQLPSSGRDLMLAVDLSGSMQQRDLQLQGQHVTRLAVVKQVLGDFIKRRQGDRIGLLLFGTQAYLQAPLTFDLNTVATLLNESQLGFAGEKTAIGDAIGLAIKRLRHRPKSQRLLILLTDGSNTAGEISPLKAAELAQQQHIKIHTIGVGAARSLQPSLLGGTFGARHINPSANIDEAVLKQIAEQTQGRYFRAHNTDELEQIYALLDQLEPVVQEHQKVNPVRSLFMWPLGLALLLSLWLFFLKVGLQRGLLSNALSDNSLSNNTNRSKSAQRESLLND